MPKERFIIIDGNSLVHRAYHALPPLSTSRGIPTNAVFGFVSMILKIVKDFNPQYLAVAFDIGKITFRHNHFQKYKANRKKTPDDLVTQFSLVKKVLSVLDISLYEAVDYEADDIIGTIACLVSREKEDKIEILVVSGDKDILQLVSGNTKALLTKKGLSQLTEYTPELVAREYEGLTPQQLIDLKSLMGDASDNIPGVPGIGPKTALLLVKEFGSLENVLDNIDKVGQKRVAGLLNAYAEQALLSKKLSVIEKTVPLDFNLAECCCRIMAKEEVRSLFRELEFFRLLKELPDTPACFQKEKDKDYDWERLKVFDTQQFLMKLDKLSLNQEVGFYLQKDGDFPVLGLAFNSCGMGVFLPAEKKERQAFLKKVSTYLISAGAVLLCADAKEFYRDSLRNDIEELEVQGDVVLSSYLLNSTASSYDLDNLYYEHFEQELPVCSDKTQEAASRAVAVEELGLLLRNKLKIAGMEKLYEEIELPLSRVLAEMEMHGVCIDLRRLESFERYLEQRLEVLSADIFSLAGEEFNINSPKQLANILFVKLGLKTGKRTKTGYSTSAEVLEELALEHRIAALLLDYRQVMKLKTTYVEGLKNLLNPHTQKVHTTFNQTVTATGRLSSTEPNLQNIPIRLEEGRKLRKVFIPCTEDHLLLAADYSQIELRVLAHISGDPALIEAFSRDQDIHARTAVEIFGVSREELTPEIRRRAKAVNFGIVYGISDYGLARDLGISRQEAGNYIETYFERYPMVKFYMERVVAEAYQNGYVKTIFNRRRYLPDLFSPNKTVQGFARRMAINSPIQGSAADIIKNAMVKIREQLNSSGYAAVMTLQVHDELVFEVSQKELQEVAELVKTIMEKALELDVSLKVDMKYGKDWYDMQIL